MKTALYTLMFLGLSSSSFIRPAKALGGRPPATAQSVTVSFPKNFLWGFASAGHQVEGDSHDNWTAYENNGLNPDGSPDLADDEWNRWKDDFLLMKKLHMTTYRMSIEWSRVEPREGEIDEAAVGKYREQIRFLIDNGIEPQITLQHFTFPQWVQAKGGWTWDRMPEAITKFTRLAFKRIGPDVKRWYTFNEPNVAVFLAYYNGIHPPFEKHTMDSLEVPFVNLVQAHVLMYHALHEEAAALKKTVAVSIAQHLRDFEPNKEFNPLDWLAKNQGIDMWNWNLIDVTQTGVFRLHVTTEANIKRDIPEAKGTLDFIGINYYSGSRVGISLIKREAQIHPFNNDYKTDLGWDIAAPSFYNVLKQAHARYPNMSFMITENGVADARDAIRKPFLMRHLFYLNKAMSEGVPVEGFCQWSLVDTKEWGLGWHAKFGAVAVDPITQARTLRPSGQFYAEVAEKGGFEADPNEMATPILAPAEPLPTKAQEIFWSKDARVFSNAEGCRIAFDPTLDSQGKAAVKIYVGDANFDSNPSEGILTLRLSDLIPVQSPWNCHTFEPFVALKSKDVGEVREHSLTCGGAYDHYLAEFSFTTPVTSTADLSALNAVTSFNYKESMRPNDASKNEAVDPPLPPTPRRTRVEIHCADLKPETEAK